MMHVAVAYACVSMLYTEDHFPYYLICTSRLARLLGYTAYRYTNTAANNNHNTKQLLNYENLFTIIYIQHVDC